MKTGVIKRILSAALVASYMLLLSGCLHAAGGASYETIRYDGKTYTACGNTVLLDYRLPGTATWEDMQKALLTKVGETKGSTVFAIKGFDSGSWIYCHFEPMLGNGPVGVYHSADIKMESVSDFKPNGLQVYTLTKPTASGSGTESLYRSTADQPVIDSVVKAILGGKELSPGDFQAAQKKDLSYENAQQYRLEFTSPDYPNLRYLYDYTVGADGTFCVLSDRAGFELGGDLLKLLEAG